MTANEHYRRAVALLEDHDRRVAELAGQDYPALMAQTFEMGLMRTLKLAEIQMMMANYKAGT